MCGVPYLSHYKKHNISITGGRATDSDRGMIPPPLTSWAGQTDSEVIDGLYSQGNGTFKERDYLNFFYQRLST